jgi:hypothetical protein
MTFPGVRSAIMAALVAGATMVALEVLRSLG